jgi:ABC-type dipeptide/oligopeptide/nickel transport system permease subunit
MSYLERQTELARSSSTGPARMALDRLVKKRTAMAALAAVVLIALAGLLAPVVAPYDPLLMNTGSSFVPPSAQHLFGTDLFGRDILSRTVYGARVSLTVAFAAVAMACVAGVTLGLVAGYYGGPLEVVVMRTMDMLLAFPGVFLALIVVALLGTGITNAVLAVGLSAIPTYTRTVRGCVAGAKAYLYVDAARLIGCRDREIMVRHILPNVIAPVIVLATLGVAWAILNICSLSFLGLGAQPPTPEWGTMLFEGRGWMRQAWWATTFPGLAIMLTVLAVNQLGDGIRDAIDPRLPV